jgi:hypothetical protein
MSNGNVAGIYYFSSFSNIHTFNESMDICDCYSLHYNYFETFEINNMLDIGDMKKLKSLTNNTIINKYINSLNFNIYLDNNNINYINYCNIIDKLTLKFKYILSDISPLIEYFSFINSINNIKITYSINYILNDIFSNIKLLYYNNIIIYNYLNKIHDMNMLFDINNIDQNISLLFGITGLYNILNSDLYYFIINNNTIALNIETNLDIIINEFNNQDYKKIIIYMCILQSLLLVIPTKSDIHKCITNYHYGIYLYHKYIIDMKL